MSENAVRLQAINNVEGYVPPTASFDAGEEPGEIFGSNVFSRSVMQQRLPKGVFKSVMGPSRRAQSSIPSELPTMRTFAGVVNAGSG